MQRLQVYATALLGKEAYMSHAALYIATLVCSLGLGPAVVRIACVASRILDALPLK